MFRLVVCMQLLAFYMHKVSNACFNLTLKFLGMLWKAMDVDSATFNAVATFTRLCICKCTYEVFACNYAHAVTPIHATHY